MSAAETVLIFGATIGTGVGTVVVIAIGEKIDHRIRRARRMRAARR